jgi:hypothetical protein
MQVYLSRRSRKISEQAKHLFFYPEKLMVNNLPNESTGRDNIYFSMNYAILGLMNKLTNKQEKFAEAIAMGVSQSEAYRMAYPVSLAWKAASVHNKASAMAKNGEVLARVEKLKVQTMALLVWHRQRSIDVLAAIATDESIKASDRIAAVDKLNHMQGFYKLQNQGDALANDPSAPPKPVIDVKKLSDSALKELIDARVS